MSAPSDCQPGADNAFGPWVISCREGFDFTLLFEQAILCLVPLLAFFTASAYRVFQLFRQDTKTVSSSRVTLKTAKLIAILCFAATQLALVASWTSSGADPTRLSIATAALSLAGALVLALLSYVEHDRSVRPSLVISTYLLFSILFDTSQARTLWLRERGCPVAGIFTAGIIFKVVILILETTEKRRILRAPYCHYSPEALGGIVNRSVFWWINSLLLKGSSRLLEPTDLFQLDHDLTSEKLQWRFRRAWKASRKRSVNSLLFTSLFCLWREIIAIVIPRLCLIGFTFSQPLLINRAVSLLSEPDSQRRTDVGRALIGATALIYIGIAVSTVHYRHNTYRYITMVRGGLIGLIYDTTLVLDAHAATDTAAITLMSTDIDRIVAGFEFLDTLWATPIEMGLAIFLLQRQIGIACLAPLIVALICILATFSTSKASAKSQKAWVEAVQVRVAATASVLTNIKGIKMTGLVDLFSTELQNLRVAELRVSGLFRKILAVNVTIGNFSPIVIPVITFVVYVLGVQATTGANLNPTLAFTSLSLISLLGRPINTFSSAYPRFAASVGCFQRIQNYLLCPVQKIERLPQPVSSVAADTDAIELRDFTFKHCGLEESPTAETILRAENVDVAYQEMRVPILHDISLRIRSGTLNIVTGPIGSGKSTLLLGLLDELYITKGFIYTSPSLQVGYCSQEPWLPNVTIRQIITGASVFDQDWYSAVLNACALDRDLIEFPRRDESVIGSKGTSLSGGQKQRLSLARALYSRKQLLLLDDVLSGLDAATEQEIIGRVFGRNGLCRRTGLTVLLATHAVRHLHHADQVIILGPNGNIMEHGPPSALKSYDTSNGSATPHKSSQYLAVNETGTSLRTQTRNMDEDNGNELRADISRQTGDVQLYYYYMKSLGWQVTIATLCGAAIFAFGYKFPDVWIKWWSEAESKRPGEDTAMYIGVYGSFAGIALMGLVAVVWILMVVGVPRSSNGLHRILLTSVMAAPYSFFVSTDPGQTLNRFSQDMSLVDMQLPIALLQTIDATFSSTMEAALIATASKWTAVMYPPFILVLYILQKFYLRTSRQLRLLDLEAKSPLYSHFLETLQGLPTIRAFRWQRNWELRNLNLLDESQRPFYLMYSIQRWLNLVLDLIVAMFAVIVMTLATQLKGSSTGGSLGVSLVNILSFSSTLTYLIRCWTDLETSIGAIARIKSFEQETPCEHLPAEKENPPAEWPMKGEINIDSLSSSYKMDSEPVLRDISISISRGHKVGICGRTGSGKSSFILTLLRLAEITNGEVSIDGVHLASLSRNAIRRSFTVMPQDPLILSGTVRFNADPFSCHSDESIVSALREVGVWDVIAARGGLDAELDANPLSRGQQQLFCLVRALLDKSRVLILDEVTSNVDRETERKIMDVIKRNFVDSTVLAIAHHLDTIRDFDKILILDQGRVLEWGAPGDLLARQSRFRELWESQ